MVKGQGVELGVTAMMKQEAVVECTGQKQHATWAASFVDESSDKGLEVKLDPSLSWTLIKR